MSRVCTAFTCREKYMDDLMDVVKKIKNDLRMSNWVQLSTGGSDGDV